MIKMALYSSYQLPNSSKSVKENGCINLKAQFIFPAFADYHLDKMGGIW
jgi:hypothetical protein